MEIQAIFLLFAAGVFAGGSGWVTTITAKRVFAS